jgi:hypothetical protein
VTEYKTRSKGDEQVRKETQANKHRRRRKKNRGPKLVEREREDRESQRKKIGNKESKREKNIAEEAASFVQHSAPSSSATPRCTK